MENKAFEEALDYLAGTCMISPGMALEAITGTYPSDEQLTAFEEFLQASECGECEVCGWWTYPGEGNLCSSCCDELEGSDEDLNENSIF